MHQAAAESLHGAVLSRKTQSQPAVQHGSVAEVCGSTAGTGIAAGLPEAAFQHYFGGTRALGGLAKAH